MYRVTVNAIYYDNTQPHGFLVKPFTVVYDDGDGALSDIIAKRAKFMHNHIKQFVGLDYNGNIISGLTRRKKKAYEDYKTYHGVKHRSEIRGK